MKVIPHVDEGVLCFLQYEEAKTELSDLQDKYEKTEQERQSIADELEACRADMKELQEKGTKVRKGGGVGGLN